MHSFIRSIPLLALFTLGCVTTPAPAPKSAEEEMPEPPLVADPRSDPTQAPADVGAPPKNAVEYRGVKSVRLKEGNGTVHPGTFSVVRVNYTGWTTDGQMFDSSYTRGTPAEFPLNGVILGWRHGLRQMVKGERRLFWIPPQLAYEGSSGPQGMLVFDVELLDIVQQ